MGVNFYNNIKNNNKILVIKNKKTNLVSGEATIFLKNENNEIETEVFTENILVDEAINVMLFNTFLKDNMDSRCYRLNPFGTLFLINNPLLREDKNIKGIPFKITEIIGYANSIKEVGSSDLKMGTLNNVLTDFNYKSGEINFYMDFGIDKANGEFTHLCWGNYNPLHSDSDLPLHLAPLPFNKILSNIGTNMLVVNNKGQYFCIKNNKAYKVNLITVGKEFKLIIDEATGITTRTTNPLGVLFIPSTQNFLIIEAGQWWKFDNNFNFIEKFNPPDGDMSSITGFKHCFFKEHIYYIDNNKNVIKWDLNYNKISTITSIFEGYEEIFCIFASTDYIYVSVPNYILIFDTDFNYLGRNTAITEKVNYVYTNNTIINNCFITLNNGNNYLHFANVNLGAITKLPYKVLKTNKQAMCINYKFKFNFN